MMDFNYDIFSSLLNTFLLEKRNIITFKSYLSDSINNNLQKKKYMIIRHDVDRKPENSLHMAELENLLKVRGTYYFRIVPESFKTNIIKKIADLGHEIGYHYEEMELVWKAETSSVRRQKKDDIDFWIDRAYELFCENLERIRKITEIKTICMHGSPLGKFDNKIIWGKYDYKKLGIVGEPYLDINWDEFAYFTDTGRRWDGKNVSIRDKVDYKIKSENRQIDLKFKSTKDIINNIDKLPSKVMFTIHPERWNDNFLLWLQQYASQNFKNVIKRFLVVR